MRKRVKLQIKRVLVKNILFLIENVIVNVKGGDRLSYYAI